MGTGAVVIRVEQADCRQHLSEVSNLVPLGGTWMACREVSQGSLEKRLMMELIRPALDHLTLPQVEGSSEVEEVKVRRRSGHG
jgi:hypothetical protein